MALSATYTDLVLDGLSATTSNIKKITTPNLALLAQAATCRSAARDEALTRAAAAALASGSPFLTAVQAIRSTTST